MKRKFWGYLSYKKQFLFLPHRFLSKVCFLLINSPPPELFWLSVFQADRRQCLFELNRFYLFATEL